MGEEHVFVVQSYPRYNLVFSFVLVYGNSGASAARRAAGMKPHTYRNWTNQRKPCIEIGNPCMSLSCHLGKRHLLAGEWRDRTYVRSWTTWRTLLAMPVDQMIDLPCTFALDTCHIMVNWQLLKQGIHWPASHDHIAGSIAELIEVTCF